MLLLRNLLALLSLLAAFSAPARAAQPATGGITGRVQNLVSGLYPVSYTHLRAHET